MSPLARTLVLRPRNSIDISAHPRRQEPPGWRQRKFFCSQPPGTRLGADPCSQKQISEIKEMAGFGDTTLAVDKVIERAWTQVRDRALEQLQRTIEGLLSAERDRRIVERRQAVKKVQLSLAAR